MQNMQATGKNFTAVMNEEVIHEAPVDTAGYGLCMKLINSIKRKYGINSGNLSINKGFILILDNRLVRTYIR